MAGQSVIVSSSTEMTLMLFNCASPAAWAAAAAIVQLHSAITTSHSYLGSSASGCDQLSTGSWLFVLEFLFSLS